MAVTVADLIARREEIKNKRKDRYDIETSIGTIIVKQPTLRMIDDILKGQDNRQNDIELIFETVIEPNLKDKDLQQAYGCTIPSDIVPMLFKPGEVSALARTIMRLAGFGASFEAKIHEEIKNS